MNLDDINPQSHEDWLIESQVIVRSMSQRELDAVLYALGHLTSGASAADQHLVWTPEKIANQLQVFIEHERTFPRK